MAKRDDTSKARPDRNLSKEAAHVASTAHSDTAPPSHRSSLAQAIEAERAKLLQAQAVIKCLYEVLLYADGEDAVTYAEAAYVAAQLIDDSVAQLDHVRLRPLIEAIQISKAYECPEERMDSSFRNNKSVKEERAAYLC